MKNVLRDFILITMGSFMDACGFYFFLAPNEIAAGGISGLALVINSFFPQIPLGVLVLLMSVILLISGFLLIGSVFGIKTIYCSIAFPLMIWGLEALYPIQGPLGNDTLIQLIFGVVLSGTGLSILYNQNASSGGIDIAARILNKFYHVDMGKGIVICGFFIALLGTLAFGLEKGMYALMGVFLYGIVMDNVIAGFNISKHVTIIAAESELVKDYIVNELHRGATIYMARGAYTDSEQEVILTIVNRREFIKLRDFIKAHDSTAFVSIQNVTEVLGNGFMSF